jgi:hypothetical protein
MTKLYVVYNPNTGVNHKFQTEEEAKLAFWKIAAEMALRTMFGRPYTIIEQLEDGGEIWRNDYGQVVETERTLEQFEEILVQVRAALSQTSVDDQSIENNT